MLLRINDNNLNALWCKGERDGKRNSDTGEYKIYQKDLTKTLQYTPDYSQEDRIPPHALVNFKGSRVNGVTKQDPWEEHYPPVGIWREPLQGVTVC